LVIDPGVLAGQEVYGVRLETLPDAKPQDGDARVPGYRRHDIAQKAARQGLEVSDDIMQKPAEHPPKARFYGQNREVLPQDHSGATMRRRRLHLVASAKISA